MIRKPKVRKFVNIKKLENEISNLQAKLETEQIRRKEAEKTSDWVIKNSNRICNNLIEYLKLYGRENKVPVVYHKTFSEYGVNREEYIIPEIRVMRTGWNNI